MSKKDPIGVKPIVKLIDETNRTRHNINNNKSSLGAVSSFVSKAKDREKEFAKKEDEDTAEIIATEYLSHSLMKPRSWQVFEQKGATVFAQTSSITMFSGKVPKGQVLLIDFIECAIGWRDTVSVPLNVSLNDFLEDQSMGLANFGFELKTNKNLVETDNLNNFVVLVNRPNGFSKLNKNVLSYNGTSKTLVLTENFDYRLEYSFDQNPVTTLIPPTAGGSWFIVGRIQGYFITKQEYEKILKLTS